jgi:protein-L-isoaspartate(D-aspartate) O-methyltransferase
MIQEQLVERGIRDPAVLRAMAEVPRHRFVDPSFWGRAYGDHALPTVEGQTISQPYIVARMIELLALTGSEKVLEIGTGTGYQAVVLSKLCARVFSIERNVSLSRAARATRRDGMAQVTLRRRRLAVGQIAPMLGARHRSGTHVPQALLDQLDRRVSS